MIHIGILSDTHGYLHPRVVDFFAGVDEIWHAGDVGDFSVARQLRELKPLRAVHGNIDGSDVRIEFPEIHIFQVEQVTVLMTHIGGYPGRYNPKVRHLIEKEKPKLFVCGHSHILKVMYDKQYEMLTINPGSAGKYGMHKSITAVRLIIEGDIMHDLEVIDVPR
jgi:putative phosphoesterase